MYELLTKIYYGQIDLCNAIAKSESSDKENTLFEKLENELTKEQFLTFQEFLSLYADRYSDYQEHAFIQGVKFGFQLAQELTNIKI